MPRAASRTFHPKDKTLHKNDTPNGITNGSTDPHHDHEPLRALGWSDHFEQQLAGMTPPPLPDERPARVISALRGRFLVADGQGERLCAPSGRLLRGAAYPVTGDWVLARAEVITRVIPRRNMLSRGEAGSRHARPGQPPGARREQPMAANLDTVLVVCGLDRDYNPRRIERYLTLIHNCGLAPAVALTKADLRTEPNEPPEEALAEVRALALGAPVVLVSAVDGRGLAEVAALLAPGRTVAMVGSSGAGKSTLANRLHGSDIQATRTVSASVGKGRHTTTVRELLRMPQGGLLMDNPGIREIAFADGGHGADLAFADIRELATGCRFADCAHQGEPGCAVLRAVEKGNLPPERLESWRRMARELDYAEARREKTADRVEKERWKEISLRLKRMKKGGR
jgi:ribosome biogenesis GTPase